MVNNNRAKFVKHHFFFVKKKLLNHKNQSGTLLKISVSSLL